MITKEATIGEKIKKRRETLGYSLRKLARMTGLSASFLSQVELNQTNMSLASLHKVAAALEVPLLFFLGDKIPRHDTAKTGTNGSNDLETNFSNYDDRLVTRDSRTKLIMQKSGVTYELMVPSMGRKMIAFQRQLSPGHDHPVRRTLKEPTEELVYVLSGDLLVELTTGQYLLHPEDTMYFEGHELLCFECASKDQDVVWVTVITPSIF